MPPPIVGISEGHGEQFNDCLAHGQSAFPCYEPIFGYRLQSFPWGILRGPLTLPGHYLRNPACYIYGRENGCVPGDDFTRETASAEAAFGPTGRFRSSSPGGRTRPISPRWPAWRLSSPGPLEQWGLARAACVRA